MRYGQRGGDGPTRGKKARTFEATMPDGTVVRKRSFHADDLDIAPWSGGPYAYCYQHGGKWYIAGIAERGCQRLSHYESIPAREVTQ